MILPDYSRQHWRNHLAECQTCRTALVPEDLCETGAVYLMVLNFARRHGGGR